MPYIPVRIRCFAQGGCGKRCVIRGYYRCKLCFEGGEAGFFYPFCLEGGEAHALALGFFGDTQAFSFFGCGAFLRFRLGILDYGWGFFSWGRPTSARQASGVLVSSV